jgi:hypothetical protein
MHEYQHEKQDKTHDKGGMYVRSCANALSQLHPLHLVAPRRWEESTLPTTAIMPLSEGAFALCGRNLLIDDVPNIIPDMVVVSSSSCRSPPRTRLAEAGLCTFRNVEPFIETHVQPFALQVRDLGGREAFLRQCNRVQLLGHGDPVSFG